MTEKQKQDNTESSDEDKPNETPENPSVNTVAKTVSEPTQRNLITNVLSLLTGTVGSKGLAMVSVVVLTRYLGVEQFGRYTLVFTLWAMLNTLVDLGTSALLGREIAKDEKASRNNIESVIFIRLIACALFFGPAYFIARKLGLTPDLIFLTFYGIFVGFEAYYDCYFSATMQLTITAKTRFISSWVSLILMIIAVVFKFPLALIILIALSTPLIKLGLDYYYAGGFKISISKPDWQKMKGIVLDSWPLWIMGLEYIILARVDNFMLVSMSPETGEADLGIYSAAFRISEILALVIGAICPSILPILVKTMNVPEKIQFITSTGTRAIIFLLSMVSLILFWYAPVIIDLLYGINFAPSAECLQILIWGQVLVALNTLGYQLLMVYNVQGKRPVMISTFSMVAINILLNLFLIPLYQHIGACWSTLLTEIAMTVTTLYFLHHYTPIRLTKDLLLMGGLTFISCLLPIFFGGFWGFFSVILLALFVSAFQIISPTDIKKLADARLDEDPQHPNSQAS